MTDQLLGKRKGICFVEPMSCGCVFKFYVGGKVVVIGCNKPHKNRVYHVCPSCGKQFTGEGHHGNGKKAMKKCVWSHAQ